MKIETKTKLLIILYIVSTLLIAHFAFAQSFFKGPALIEGLASTVTAGATTTLTKDSQTNQQFTGTSNQTLVLPNATTLPLYRYFQIENRSTGTITVQTNGGGALTTVLAGTQKQVLVTNIGSAAGTWDVSAINIADVAGVLPIVNGGTALSTTPNNGQLLIGNGTNYSLATIAGTTNQVNVTNGAGTITLATPQDIATTSSPTFASPTITGDITLSNVSFDSEKVGDLLAVLSSTGVRSGAVMSINADPTKFDVATGVGYIVNYSTPSAPTIDRIAIGPFTAQTVTNLASADFTWILINSSGSIVQQTTVPTPTQRRQNIVLGRLNHSNRTNISFANTLPDFEFSPVSQLGDLMDSLGPFNISGNMISANGANLSLNKSAGTIFQKSFNYSSSTTNPHIVTTGGLTALSFAYQNQTGAPGSSVTVLDPTTYDVAGVTTTVPASNNATVQRVYLFGSNTIRIQRGQAFYPSFANALQDYAQETFNESPLISGFAVPVAFIVITKGCTSLQNTSCAKIIPAGKFGGSTSGASGGSTTLQQAYNNSVQPQIVVDSTQLGVQIRDASTPIGSSLFAVQNNAGSTNYLGVDVNGISTTNFVGTGTTGAIRSHNLTTTQKNALTAAVGMQVYDTTLGQFSFYNGTWQSLMVNPMTTGGDLIYGGASGTPTRLANGTAGQYLVSAGGTSAPVWTTPTLPTVQRFTSGSGTYTTPAGVKYIVVKMVGGGAGGSGSGTANASSAGGDGVATTFGTSLLTAGQGMGAGFSSASGSAGSPTVNAPAVTIIAVAGGRGASYAQHGTSGIILPGGNGGSSFLGGAGGGVPGGAGQAAAANSGSGGAGGGTQSSASTFFSGSGGSSGAYIEALITSPSATYSYGVGGGGTGGSAGTGGNAGGNGAAGMIEVTEYY